MVAFNRVRCTVVAVSEHPCLSRGALAREVLPWADPYVAQLIKKLQDEVRDGAHGTNRALRRHRLVGAEATAA